MNTFEDERGIVRNVYRCYVGSSKMNTAEMSRLLDEAVKMAAENGIYIEEIMEA